jgi:hypothetical protein
MPRAARDAVRNGTNASHSYGSKARRSVEPGTKVRASECVCVAAPISVGTGAAVRLRLRGVRLVVLRRCHRKLPWWLHVGRYACVSRSARM